MKKKKKKIKLLMFEKREVTNFVPQFFGSLFAIQQGKKKEINDSHGPNLINSKK